MGLTKTIPFDIDARRFIFATGITNFNQKRAVDYLVKGLKTNGLWAKMAAVYPMVGGTPFTCKFNLVNPRDTNIAFRLNFVAAPTISLQGVKWNGTTQYADTFLTPSTSASVLTLNSAHISYYSLTDIQESTIIMGTTVNAHLFLALRQVTNSLLYNNNNVSAGSPAQTNTDSRGFYISSRLNSTQIIGSKNGVAVTLSVNSTALPGNTIYLGARNNNVPASFGTQQCAFASIGSGLSAADAFNMYQIVQQFQIILNRQV